MNQSNQNEWSTPRVEKAAVKKGRIAALAGAAGLATALAISAGAGNSPSENQPNEPKTVTIQEDQTVWDIAKNNYGLEDPKEIQEKVGEIAEVNKIPNINGAREGQVLILPGLTNEAPDK